MWPFKPKRKGILLTGRIRNAFGDVINAPLEVTILEETDIKYKIRIIRPWHWLPATWVDKNRIEIIKRTIKYGQNRKDRCNCRIS